MAPRIPGEARADHIKLATHRRRLARAGEGKLGLKKIYAVGLEMLCPGGAYAWAPEIPSADTLAGSVPSKCELVHNSCSFFPDRRGTSVPRSQRMSAAWGLACSKGLARVSQLFQPKRRMSDGSCARAAFAAWIGRRFGKGGDCTISVRTA